VSNLAVTVMPATIWISDSVKKGDLLRDAFPLYSISVPKTASDGRKLLNHTDIVTWDIADSFHPANESGAG
jgi:hypothetical protein